MTKLSLATRKLGDPKKLKTEALVVPVFTGEAGDSDLAAIDAVVGGNLTRTLDIGDFSGKKGTNAWVVGMAGIKRVLLVGAGARDAFDSAAQRSLAETAAKALGQSKAKDAALAMAGLALDAEALTRLLEILGCELARSVYRYTETLSNKDKVAALKKVTVDAGDALSAAKARKALDSGRAIGEGSNLTRQLVNLPGNICTPTYLAQQARKLGRSYEKIKVSVLDEKKMRELGMGSLLSVGHGSDQPSQLIVIDYRGGKAKEAPFALVGKGITFDTGGISLKPGAKMDEMKFDMGGAGSVVGTMQAIAELALPINVVAVIAAAENMPSGRATKPGDVVKSLSGKTIEILNTDAEGRLVLCDALTYVQQRYKPQEIVDIATLTGAIIVSLGNHATGIFSNNDELAASLTAAGERSHDRGWRMPVWNDYQKQLDSNFADVANIGGPAAGSITAACFLARFIENDTPWAHLDVAGTAFQSAPKGATGRPVPMLVDYLRDRAANR